MRTRKRNKGGTNVNSTLDYIKKNPGCDDSMTFQECELAVVKQIVSDLEKQSGKEIVASTDIKRMITILEQFLKDKQLICYGGTAINNILPLEAQFYDKTSEVPDYDFYSYSALDHAKELANIYYKNGFTNVEAKSGMHMGTFKVFVNFFPVADITFLPIELFNALKTQTMTVDNILYCPPNFLRMGMYLELSRPKGDVSRWEKVLSRLNLLNTYYPISSKKNCANVEFQRKMNANDKYNEKIYFIVRDSFIKHNVVFFGGFALSLYSEYMPEKYRKTPQHYPDFDVLSENADDVANKVKQNLELYGIRNVTLFEVEPLGEIIPKHIEIRINNDTIASIYTPVACHNYNKVNIENKIVRIATMDTLLSFYLAFLFSDEFNEFQDRILCMATYLFKIIELNRASNDGVLKRFTMECIGKQHTKTDLLEFKHLKYNELKQNRDTDEFNNLFLKYVPRTVDLNSMPLNKKVMPIKKQKNKKTKKSFIRWNDDADDNYSTSNDTDEPQTQITDKYKKSDYKKGNQYKKGKSKYNPTYNGDGLLDSLFWTSNRNPRNVGKKRTIKYNKY